MATKKNRTSNQKTETADARTEQKTPYQGTWRSFGEFQCKKCDQHWFSANSWANMGQQCRNCNIYVYPHHQWKIERSGKNKKEPTKRHLSELCEKCTNIGTNCAGAFVPKAEKKKSNAII